MTAGDTISRFGDQWARRTASTVPTGNGVEQDPEEARRLYAEAGFDL